MTLVLAGCSTGSASTAPSPPSTPSITSSAPTGTPTLLAAPTPTPAATQKLVEKPSSGWKIFGATPRFGISPGTRALGPLEGYANQASIAADQSVDLYVSTTAKRWRVTAYRMGWYGGKQGASVWQSGWQPGRAQAKPQTVGSTHTPTAPWKKSLTVTTQGWRPGSYLLRLEGSGHASFVPLVIRSASTQGRLVLVAPSTTWHAYNDWGGRNLYWGPAGKGDTANRARAVSYDRPYVYHHGSSEFLPRMLPVVSLAERLKLDLAYVDDVDLHRDPHLLDGARGVISMGHDEYYSNEMRANLTRARNAGTNLAFLGANSVYRRIRLESTSLGKNRLEVNYKDPAEDPVSRTNPNRTTADWPSPPKADPESSLTGSAYACFPASGDLVVALPKSWVFTHTGLKAGGRLPGILGPEFDAVTAGTPKPQLMDVVMRSPVACGAYSHADATYYTTKSGAGVFNTGTMNWVAGLGGKHGARTEQLTRQITTNVLEAFAAGRAGKAHPTLSR